jgi:hypothetical protein
MNAREERGIVIAALCKLNHDEKGWLVPSQSCAKIYQVSRRIAIVTQIRRSTNHLGKIFTPIKCPQRRLQRLQNITASANLRRLLAPKAAGGDLVDPGADLLLLPQVAAGRIEVVGEQFVFATALDGTEDQRGEVSTRVEAFSRSVS